MVFRYAVPLLIVGFLADLAAEEHAAAVDLGSQRRATVGRADGHRRRRLRAGRSPVATPAASAPARGGWPGRRADAHCRRAPHDRGRRRCWLGRHGGRDGAEVRDRRAARAQEGRDPARAVVGCAPPRPRARPRRRDGRGDRRGGGRVAPHVLQLLRLEGRRHRRRGAGRGVRAGRATSSTSPPTTRPLDALRGMCTGRRPRLEESADELWARHQLTQEHPCAGGPPRRGLRRGRAPAGRTRSPGAPASTSTATPTRCSS